MKAWIKHWFGIGKPLPPEGEIDALVAQVITKLADAQHAHISDLRVLLDKSAEREAQLAQMVQMVLEERFHRPIAPASAPRPPASTLPPEHLQDVTVFDEQADAELVQAQIETQRKIQQGLDELLHEHQEAHTEAAEAL